MRWNPIAQIQNLAQPLFLGPRECGDADPIVRATDHCSDGMRDHIQQVMAHLRAVAWILRIAKMFDQRVI